MIVSEAHGTPIAATIASASPNEVTLVDATLAERFVGELPQRIIGDGAYDSDPLDARLATRGVEMIAPSRSNRRVRTQDGRAFRRYRWRWKVERVNAWLQNFRRIVTRWEYKAETFLAFVQLACICILLRQF